LNSLWIKAYEKLIAAFFSSFSALRFCAGTKNDRTGNCRLQAGRKFGVDQIKTLTTDFTQYKHMDFLAKMWKHRENDV